VGAIQEANRLSQSHVLREGDTLRIPAGAGNPAGTGNGVTETGIMAPSIRWPITAREVSYMTGKLQGVVITGTRGEPVLSLTRGTVISAGLYRGFGRVVIIQTDGGYLYVYGGCESLSVKEGDMVGPGAELGRLGIDAVSNKPQLFFMVYRSNLPIDPATAPRA
jgi:murein DD-endopeptidase MepM/ murein hydrolase activator NlpD